MNRRTAVGVLALLTGAAIGCGGGGISSDGGQSGTGLAAIRGNVVAAPGVELELGGIRVSLSASDQTTRTDNAGRFELQARASGPAELRFERESDRLSARTDVVVPAGGVLELSAVVLDPDSDEAHPTMRRVEFEGVVQQLDCASGAIIVVAREDEVGARFSIAVASATIRRGDVVLGCSDLSVGDQIEVSAETADGFILVNAEVVVADGEDDGSDDDSGDDGAMVSTPTSGESDGGRDDAGDDG
jgi:hypothetical protein